MPCTRTGIPLRDAVIQLTQATHEGDEAKLMALLEGSERQKGHRRGARPGDHDHHDGSGASGTAPI